MRLDELWGIACFLKRMDDASFVVGTESFDRDAQFNGSAAVCSDELIMIEANDVTVLLCHDRCNIHQLARAIGQ